MTYELLILLYIGTILTVQAIVQFIFQQENHIRRIELIKLIDRLCNLLAERIDQNKNGDRHGEN